MTPEEAIKIVGDWCFNETFKRAYKAGDIRLLSDGLVELKRMVEKQILMKAVRSHFARCPACNADPLLALNYCPYCGQKIDWEETI